MRVLLLSLAIGITTLFAAVNPGACSIGNTYDIVINQVYKGGNGNPNYIELYVNRSSAGLNQWRLEMASGNQHLQTFTVSQGKLNTTNNNVGNSVTAGNFIIFNVGHNDIPQNNGEFLLKNGAGEVVHYLRYNVVNQQNLYWDAATVVGCTTHVVLDNGINAGNNSGICSKPDGDNPQDAQWQNDNCPNTQGTPNTPLNLTCANPKPFELAYFNNARGDIQIVGNTILCKRGNGGNCTAPGNDDRNNNIDMIYADIDGSNSTFASSSAQLNLPEGSRVMWAKLYWQGMLYKDGDAEKTAAQWVKFRPANSTTYQTVFAQDFNWVYYGGNTNEAEDRWYYQGAVDITNQVKAAGSGHYFVADIHTHTRGENGTNRPPGGSYGAWSIVVAYSDQNQPLRNLSVFDGYWGVVGGGDVTGARNYANANGCDATDTGIGLQTTVDIPISGFLTPLVGDVNSTFLIFGGEGDAGDGTGDRLYLFDKSGHPNPIYDALNPEENIMNARITRKGQHVTTKNPNYVNNLGIDIMTFDISGIIENNQKETTARMSTTGDGYQPGVFAFSTNLYTPDLCYTNEHIYKVKNGVATELENGSVIALEDLIRTEVTIRNDGKDIAKRIRLSHPFESPLHVYKAQSLTIGGESQSDAEGDDRAFYRYSTDRAYFNLGHDANATDGGWLAIGESALPIGFDRNISAPGILELLYFIDYSDSTEHINLVGTQIERCAGDPGSGPFVLNIRDQALLKVWDALLGENPADKKLLTKVAGSGTVDYRARLSKLEGYEEPGQVKIYINTNLQPSTDQQFCPVDPDPKWREMGTLQDLDLSTYTVEDISIPATAHQKMVFQFKVDEGTTESGGTIPEVIDCTDEAFAVRPASLGVSWIGTQPLTAGAIQTQGVGVQAIEGYNPAIDKLTWNVIDEKPLAHIGALELWGGFNGNQIAYLDINYSEAGAIDLNLTDSLWTAVDQPDDCIAASSSTTPENGKVGCDIEGVTAQTRRFIPAHFALTPAGFGPASVYYGDIADQNASLSFTATAQNAQNRTTLNYDGALYAQETNLSVTLEGYPGGAARTLNAQTPVGAATEANFDGSFTLENVGKGAFANGVADMDIRFNFARTPSSPIDPVRLTGSTFALQDADTVAGNGNIAGNIDFYYGRIHAPDISTVEDSAQVRVYAEVYCTQNCNHFGLNQTSIDSRNWWQLAPGGNTEVNLTSALGNEDLMLGGTMAASHPFAFTGTRPHKAIIHLGIPGYLWYRPFAKDYEAVPPGEIDSRKGCYNHPCATIEFLPQAKATNWGGTGTDTGKRRFGDDANETRQPQRVGW